MAGGLVAVFGGSASAAAPPPVNVANDHVVCNTVTGQIKFVPALTLAGSGPGDSNLITKVDGCSDTDQPSAINLEAGAISVKGTLHSATSSCTALLGTTTVTTTVPIVFKWKVVPGTAKPLQPTSTVTLSSIQGGLFSPGGTWGGAQYGDFQVTTGATVSGAFTGGDSGHSSSLEATTGQDAAAFGAQCAGKGLKAATLGIGHINLG
jgi:hypothetical protein